MTAAPGSLIDELLHVSQSAIARREDTGVWHAAETARAAHAVLLSDAQALRPLDPALEHLRLRFGLDRSERLLLALAMLPEMHPSAHLLAGVLSGDSGPARPSVALALELVGIGTADGAARALLHPDGPLSGLLTVEGDSVMPARRLRVPDRVAAHLLGSTQASDVVARVITPARAVDLDGFTTVAAALAAGEPLVWVRAPVGTAGAALAVAGCRAAGADVIVADLGRVPGDVATDAAGASLVRAAPDQRLLRETLRELILEASLRGVVLVLLAAHHAGGHIDLLERATVPVVAVGRSAWEPHWADRLPVTVQAGRLARPDRELLWHEAVGTAAVTDAIVAMRLSPEEIDLVGARARADAAVQGRAPSSPDVLRAIRGLSAAHDRRVTGATPATSADLVLPEHTRKEVERLLGWARNRDEVLGLGDLQGKGGKGTGICALFSGSPGTGKTLAAHVVADSLGAELIQVDLAAVVDKYIGETEKNLERVFSRAESLNAVLFFDEADALFGSRSAVNDARDRYANQEVSYLLQRMEEFEGITVLATNLRGNLDPAFARRLHFMIHFPDPDAPTRRCLWQHHLDQLPGTDVDDPPELDLLAEALELSGGDIRNIVLAATYNAVAGRRLVGMQDLRLAAEREMAKLGRRVVDSGWRSARPR